MRIYVRLCALSICLSLFLLAGCTTGPDITSTTVSSPRSILPNFTSGGFYHVVQKGETLWRISQLYGLGVNDLARRNRLRNASKIRAGQRIYIPKNRSEVNVVTRPIPKSGEDFIWPVTGKVISFFGTTEGGITNKGICISSLSGHDVVASRSGKIVFSDDFFKGFGKTIILDHGDDFSTVYAHNSEILVSVGDIVKQRQVIAKIGSTGRASVPGLYFEIRRKHKAQNPLFYLKGS